MVDAGKASIPKMMVLGPEVFPVVTSMVKETALVLDSSTPEPAELETKLLRKSGPQTQVLFWAPLKETAKEELFNPGER